MTGVLIRRGKSEHRDMHREETDTQEESHVTAEGEIEPMYL